MSIAASALLPCSASCCPFVEALGNAPRLAHPPTLHILQGFDEYMNLVLDEAEEVYTKKGHRKQLGRSFYSEYGEALQYGEALASVTSHSLLFCRASIAER